MFFYKNFLQFLPLLQLIALGYLFYIIIDAISLFLPNSTTDNLMKYKYYPVINFINIILSIIGVIVFIVL